MREVSNADLIRPRLRLALQLQLAAVTAARPDPPS
jgi:hypothetical protein